MRPGFTIYLIIILFLAGHLVEQLNSLESRVANNFMEKHLPTTARIRTSNNSNNGINITLIGLSLNNEDRSSYGDKVTRFRTKAPYSHSHVFSLHDTGNRSGLISNYLQKIKTDKTLEFQLTLAANRTHLNKNSSGESRRGANTIEYSDFLTFVQGSSSVVDRLLRLSSRMGKNWLTAASKWSAEEYIQAVFKHCQVWSGARKRGLGLVFPHPASCAWYINCSLTPDAILLTYFSGYVMECPYPQLFSTLTLQCEDFKDVNCQSRFEPKTPCEYRANQCHQSSHCIPCWLRYSSCRGLSEGLNAWPGLEWHKFFVECHQERTVFQGVCNSRAVFSPITRACETPLSIPSQHGGWKPGCSGRRDGLYPDELGRCHLYFLCQAQLFRGFHRCKAGYNFDPFTSSCQTASRVPYPCGDLNQPDNICQGKQDDNYLDLFGRCNHYFTCRNNTVAGLYVCSQGIFNVLTGHCDTSVGVRANIPQPCGDIPNVCQNQPDGVYIDNLHDVHTKISISCPTTVTCEKGLVILSNSHCGIHSP